MIFWHIIQICGYAAELLGNNPWENIRNDDPGLRLSGPRVLPTQPTNPFLWILCSLIRVFVYQSGVLLNPPRRRERGSLLPGNQMSEGNWKPVQILVLIFNFREIIWDLRGSNFPVLNSKEHARVPFWEKEKAANVLLPEPRGSHTALVSRTAGVTEGAWVHREGWKHGDPLELGWSPPRKMGASW